MSEALRRAFSDRMDGLLPQGPQTIGVAVSGGGDSVALMALLADYCASTPHVLKVASVDHGLRPEAKAEVARVSAQAADLGLSHTVLEWSGGDSTGNLQANARAARYALLADWAAREAVSVVCLGHTQDDQAETLLLRLARGSGVDGLAAMQSRRAQDGILWLRPLLDTTRAELRTFLTVRDLRWSEDPSNEDPGFDRVKTRQSLDTLSDLGITRARLSETASALQRAQNALGQRAADVARRGAVRFDWGDMRLHLATLASLDPETRLRLLAETLRWVSGSVYRPRLRALSAAWAAVSCGKGATLHGCGIFLKRGWIWVHREYKVVKDLRADPGQTWDARWAFGTGVSPALHLQALGDSGLSQLGAAKEAVPRAALRATPAIWAEDTLVSVPRLTWGVSVEIDRCPEPSSFYSKLIPH